jgi:hypothetical protein
LCRASQSRRGRYVVIRLQWASGKQHEIHPNFTKEQAMPHKTDRENRVIELKLDRESQDSPVPVMELNDDALTVVAGGGGVTHQEITVWKYLDKATPKIY